MGKDPVFSLLTPTGAQSMEISGPCAWSLALIIWRVDILTADRETHVRQRRLLSHAFSEKALREQEPILQYYVDKFLHQISLRATEPLDLTAWFHFISMSSCHSSSLNWFADGYLSSSLWLDWRPLIWWRFRLPRSRRLRLLRWVNSSYHKRTCLHTNVEIL